MDAQERDGNGDFKRRRRNDQALGELYSQRRIPISALMLQLKASSVAEDEGELSDVFTVAWSWRKCSYSVMVSRSAHELGKVRRHHKTWQQQRKNSGSRLIAFVVSSVLQRSTMPINLESASSTSRS